VVTQLISSLFRSEGALSALCLNQPHTEKDACKILLLSPPLYNSFCTLYVLVRRVTVAGFLYLWI